MKDESRGARELSGEKDYTLKKWMVCKCERIKRSSLQNYNKNLIINKKLNVILLVNGLTCIDNQHTKNKLKLDETMLIHKDFGNIEHQYIIKILLVETPHLEVDMLRIHSNNTHDIKVHTTYKIWKYNQ